MSLTTANVQPFPPAPGSDPGARLDAELRAALRDDPAVWGKLEGLAFDALWVWDLGDRSRRWTSPQFLERLGYATEGPAGVSTWQEVCDPDDLRGFERAVDAAAARGGDGGGIRQSVCLHGANGRDTVAEVYGVYGAGRDGRPGRIVGFLRSQDGESHLEQLLDETNAAARIGAWSVNLVTETVFWTRMVYEIHELDPATFTPTVSTGVQFYREGYSRDRIREVLDRCMEEREPWDEVLEIVTAKGNLRWVRAIGHAEFRNGKVVRLVGSFQDIHEQKLRALQVATSEALLSAHFDLAPHGMVIATDDGRLERVSRSFAEMLGYGEDELVGREYAALTHPGDRPEDEAYFAQLRAGEIDSFRREKRYLGKDGGTVWADAAVAAIRTATGDIYKYSIQLVDISEVKAAEAYRVHMAFLEDKAREMEQFAYIASHDLRQPVLTLRGYLDALREDYDAELDESGREYITIMEAAVTRMDSMIKGLLDYTRLSKTRDLEDVDLARVVSQVTADLEGLRRAVGGTIHVAELPRVRGHRVELRQVFQNIIANALKYHRPGHPPVVEVTCRRVESGYEFCVSDNGLGISASDQVRIFALFQRVGAASDAEGTGIGLASCKTIVERHGGSISVNSTLGQGSEFRFSILTDNFV